MATTRSAVRILRTSCLSLVLSAEAAMDHLLAPSTETAVVAAAAAALAADLNLTWGEAWANPLANSTSTSTSALGHVLTKGTYLGAGLHGTTPSGTSNYFSVDVGMVHIAVWT